jgi:3-phenylpropionate/trans-cinnamate dioxygenase ferredoxin reductase component
VVRTLPGTESMVGVHTLRSLDDCLALRDDLDKLPNRVVVIGAGFIGAEVAATARNRGLEVTVIEALPSPLYRGLGTEMGMIAAELHRGRGTDLRLGVGVEGLDVGGDGRVSRVRLTDGSAVDAEVVVVGIGVRPCTDWLEGSGLTLDNGVVCDETLLAAPGVVAAGDLARWPNRHYGEVMRLEHWENAVEMGRAAGLRLLAGDHDSGWDGAGAEPFESIGWFWSDQYDRKIQLAGHPGPDDQVEVVLGSVEDHRFVALYHRDDRVTAVLGFSRPAQVVKFRQLLDSGPPGPSLAEARALAHSLRPS